MSAPNFRTSACAKARPPLARCPQQGFGPDGRRKKDVVKAPNTNEQLDVG